MLAPAFMEYALNGDVPQNVNFAVRLPLLVALMQSLDLEPVAVPDQDLPTLSLADVADIGKRSTVQVLCQ